MTTTEDGVTQSQDSDVEPIAWQAKQAAKRLSIPYRTLMRMINNGEIETVRAGRYYLVPEWVIQRFLGSTQT